MSDFTDVRLRIDWNLLRKQKQWLIAQPSENADGLLALIDHIQDTAVLNGIPESTVFSKGGK